MEKKIENDAKCVGCTACMNICPVQAISMREERKGFLYPYVDKSKCIYCKKCISVCPLNAKVQKEKHPKVFAVISRNINIRLHSSSGGIAYELVREFQEKGNVYAAVFDSDWNVVHEKIENKKQLRCMMGSKYVQSDLNDIFQKIRQDIENGNEVLFIGTPCQVAGLNNFLGEVNNLTTIDFVCHGVPTKKIWHDYLNDLKKKYGSEIKSISQRSKNLKGWHNFNIRIFFKNGKKYERLKNKDRYMCLFLNDYILRDCCFECRFRNFNRVSDITLGDFWGIESINSSLNDDKGTSLVLINTKNGDAFFESIKGKCLYERHSVEEIMQTALKKRLVVPKNREKFWELYHKEGYCKAVKIYGRRTMITKILYNICLPLVRKFGIYQRAIKVYEYMTDYVR